MDTTISGVRYKNLRKSNDSLGHRCWETLIEGYLHKKKDEPFLGGRMFSTWQRKYVVVTPTTLAYSRGDSGGAGKLEGEIKLNTIQQLLKTEGFGISITSGDRYFMFRAHDQIEFDKWYKVLVENCTKPDGSPTVEIEVRPPDAKIELLFRDVLEELALPEAAKVRMLEQSIDHKWQLCKMNERLIRSHYHVEKKDETTPSHWAGVFQDNLEPTIGQMQGLRVAISTNKREWLLDFAEENGPSAFLHSLYNIAGLGFHEKLDDDMQVSKICRTLSTRPTHSLLHSCTHSTNK